MSEKDMFGSAPAAVPKPRSTVKPKSTTRPKFSWFFALRPADEEAERIFISAQALLAAAGITGARITPDRLHITLEWIGDDIDEDAVARACTAADSIRFPALQALFTAIKTFPAPSGPCVLLGAEGLDDVRKLRGDLARALAAHGFKPPRSYEPHMTLCYDRAHRLARTPIESISFRAVEFTLVKSHLGLSRHEVMRSWPLRA